MRKIFSGKSQIVGGGATKTLHSGPGKIFSLIITNEDAAAGTLTLYDDISAAAGNILFKAAVVQGSPLVIHFPQNTPIVFTAGLTAVSAALTRAFIITEAEV